MASRVPDLVRCSLRSRAPLIALFLACIANACTIANIFPYAPAMMLHLGITDDKRELGFYAGFLMSAYQLGQMLTSYHLGVLADRWGRKSVILLGLWGCTAPQLLFGLDIDPTLVVYAARLTLALLALVERCAPPPGGILRRSVRSVASTGNRRLDTAVRDAAVFGAAGSLAAMAAGLQTKL